MGEFTRGPMDSGYSQTPHGLWTLEVSTGARVLLGWLHSHSDRYLASVTVNMARRTLNTSSVAAWLRELDAAGFVLLERKPNGQAARVELLVEPWIELHRRRKHRAETGPPQPSRDRPGNRAETGPVTEPKPARVVNQVGNQLGDQNPPTPQGGSGDDGFLAWWMRYPRKIDRAKCERRWRLMNATQRTAAHEGLSKWIAYWDARGEADKVPHPTTWLNNERWLADPPKIGPTLKPGSGLAALQRQRESLQGGST